MYAAIIKSFNCQSLQFKFIRISERNPDSMRNSAVSEVSFTISLHAFLSVQTSKAPNLKTRHAPLLLRCGNKTEIASVALAVPAADKVL